MFHTSMCKVCTSPKKLLKLFLALSIFTFSVGQNLFCMESKDDKFFSREISSMRDLLEPYVMKSSSGSLTDGMNVLLIQLSLLPKELVFPEEDARPISIDWWVWNMVRTNDEAGIKRETKKYCVSEDDFRGAFQKIKSSQEKKHTLISKCQTLFKTSCIQMFHGNSCIALVLGDFIILFQYNTFCSIENSFNPDFRLSTRISNYERFLKVKSDHGLTRWFVRKPESVWVSDPSAKTDREIDGCLAVVYKFIPKDKFVSLEDGRKTCAKFLLDATVGDFDSLEVITQMPIFFTKCGVWTVGHGNMVIPTDENGKKVFLWRDCEDPGIGGNPRHYRDQENGSRIEPPYLPADENALCRIGVGGLDTWLKIAFGLDLLEMAMRGVEGTELDELKERASSLRKIIDPLKNSLVEFGKSDNHGLDAMHRLLKKHESDTDGTFFGELKRVLE